VSLHETYLLFYIYPQTDEGFFGFVAVPVACDEGCGTDNTGTGGSFVATNPVTLTQSGGTVSNTTIYVRLKSGLSVGTYNSENISATSTGATTQNVACSGSVTAVPSITLADNGTQVSAANVTQGTNTHVLHKFSLAVENANATLTGVQVTTAGSYASADLTNLKVRYSADATLDASDATLSTYTSVPTAGTLTFPGFTSQTINFGSTGYIFITADVASGATAGNTISVNAVTIAQLTFSSGTKSGTTNAGGTQTFVAASSGIITFDFAGLAGNEGTANSNYNNSNLSPSTISRGSGLTASANADRYNATNWALTSIGDAVTGNNYMEFTITPNSGYQFNVSSIVIQFQRSATGPSAIALRNSLDSYSANLDQIYTITDNTTTQTFTFTFTQANSSSAVTYRLYCYAEATGGSGGPGDGTGNDIVVNGNVTAAAPTPEINIKGNSVSIASGSDTPSFTDHTDFGSTDVVGGTVVRTFTIENTGTANLNLTGSSPYVSITGTHASDFSVTTIPTTPISASTNTTFQITFDPSAIGLRIATISIANDDADENPYTFAIQGTGTNSMQSDIIEDNTSYSSNINYTLYQAETITNTSHSVGVMRFTIRDGGAGNDDDALGTELNSITFSVANIDNIRTAALFDVNTMRANIPTINYGAGTITFSGLNGTNFTAPDNGARTLTLRVSFLSTVTDNAQMQFTITSATASISGSSFASFDAGGATSSITGDRNRIVVVADRLRFSQQPSNTAVFGGMTPAVGIEAVDVNSNRDLDFTGSISITSTGTLSGSPISNNSVNGLATFSGLTHTVAATGLTLTATTTGLTYSNTVVSNQFNIIDFTYLTGDFRPLYSDVDFSHNGSWEYFNGSSWGTTPGNLAPQNASPKPSRIIIDKSGITGGGNSSNTYYDIMILDGGELVLENNANPSADFISASKKLEVQDGGNLTVNGQIRFNSTANFIIRSGGTVTINNNNIANNHDFWAGVELFEGGSTFIIKDWFWSTTSTFSSLLNAAGGTISNNSQGYKFGNFILNTTTQGSNNWNLIGGSMGIVNLCYNDFIINTNGTGYVGGASNATGTNGFVINGNLIVNSGNFNFGTSFSTGTFSHQFTINGNFQFNSTGSLKIHRASTNPTTLNGFVNFKGNVTVNSAATFTNDMATDNSRMFVNINGTGTFSTPQEINIGCPMVGINTNIDNSTFVKLKSNNLSFNGITSLTTTFTLKGGSSLHFGWADNGTTPLIVTMPSGAVGTNQFITENNSTLYITHSGGLNNGSNLTTGNIQQFATSNRTFSQVATFWYVGKENQFTGDGIGTGSTAKVINVEMLDNTKILTLSGQIGFSDNTVISSTGGKLDIKKGQVVETETAYVFSCSGTLYMAPGTLYKITKGSADAVTSNNDQIPRMQGSGTTGANPYIFTGGTIELAGAVANNRFQTLRGTANRPTYKSVKYSGTNTYGVDYKNLSSQVTIDSCLFISESAVVDCIDNSSGSSSFVGDGGLNMSGTSFLRMKKVAGTTLPELLGTAAPYTLTGGTVELYGSGSTQTQSLRGTYASTNISYYNVELNAAGANVSNNAANVVAQAGFGIQGIMNVNAPTCFKIASGYTITGSGSFVVQPGATLKYGSANGITTAGTSSGNIQTANRTFPSSASYGFVGSLNQTSGDGLPSTLVNLYIDKTESNSIISLTDSVTIKNSLVMYKGCVLTGLNNILELGESTTQSGTLDYTSGYVIGNMRRWFKEINTGHETGLFPLGEVVNSCRIEQAFLYSVYFCSFSLGVS
jgi:hypothetical protein